MDSNPYLISVAARIFNKTIGFNKVKTRGCHNTLNISRSFLKKTKVLIEGNQNVIQFGEKCYLEDCKITISGNNNKILLGDRVYMKDADLYIEDDGNEIVVNYRTSICGKTHLACTEGKK